MAITREEALRLLNAPDRLDNLSRLVQSEPRPAQGKDVNNHIHTTYSFSPYSPTAAVWFARVLFGIGILFLPFLLIVNPDRYIVWYRLTSECIEYHTAFRRKRELPYSCFPYVMHGKYLHGVYWRDYIVFSDRRLKDAELNRINHVSPSAEHFIKIRYSEKTAEKLMSVLPAKYQRTVSGIKETILKRKSA